MKRVLANVEWHPACRIVPSRFPSVNLFDRVADAGDFDALYRIDAMTNDRIRDELGNIELVPRQQRLYGPGSGPIMAAFTHLNPLGSRFSDGSFGVFHAAADKATAIAETAWHQENFMRATQEPALQLQMRVYHVDVSGAFDDLRSLPLEDPVYDRTSYAASRALGRTLRERGSAGIVFNSVRAEKGACIAAFDTRSLSRCRHASQLLYRWDGSRIAEVYEKI